MWLSGVFWSFAEPLGEASEIFCLGVKHRLLHAGGKGGYPVGLWLLALRRGLLVANEAARKDEGGKWGHTAAVEKGEGQSDPDPHPHVSKVIHRMFICFLVLSSSDDHNDSVDANSKPNRRRQQSNANVASNEACTTAGVIDIFTNIIELWPKEILDLSEQTKTTSQGHKEAEDEPALLKSV